MSESCGQEKGTGAIADNIFSQVQPRDGATSILAQDEVSLRLPLSACCSWRRETYGENSLCKRAPTRVSR